MMLLAGVVSLTAMGLGTAVAQTAGVAPRGGAAEGADKEARPEPVCKRQDQKVPGELRHPRATLVLAEGADAAINFGHDRSTRLLRFDFTTEGCRFSKKHVDQEAALAVEVTLPVDAAGDRVFHGRLMATGRIRSPHDVLVEVEIRPSVACDAEDPDENGDSAGVVSSCHLADSDDEQGVEAGTYAGFVEVVDPRVNLTRVPFTMQVRYHAWHWLYLSVTVPALLLGAAASWLKSRDASPGLRFRSWVWNVRNVVGLAAGLAAARIAFQKGYFDDPDWGIDLPDAWFLWPIGSIEWWTLAVVVTTAFIGAMTPTTIGAEQMKQHREEARTVARADAEAAPGASTTARP